MSAPALLVAGCASPSYYSPVEVTRFTSAPASSLPRGPVGVQAAPGEDPTDPAYAVYQTAVTDQLDAVGFQVAGHGAPYVALIDVERWVEGSNGRRSPVSVGGGASTGSFGSGVGLGVGINLSPPDPERIETELSVSIRPSAGGEAIWEGRARFTATGNSEYADLTAAATRVTEALFEGFPGNSGETIEVQ